MVTATPDEPRHSTNPSPTSSDTPRASSSAERDRPPVDGEEFIFSFDSSSGRPLAKSAGNPRTSKDKYIELEEASDELGRWVHQVQGSIARSLYSELSGKDQIEEFLKTAESGYDVGLGQWIELPKEPSHERDLTGPYIRMINAVINHFHSSLPEGVSREAVDSHDIPMVHDNGQHFTKPGICIKATGPSFERPEREDCSGLGYTSDAAVFDVRLDKAKGMRLVHCKRLAICNRQIFIQQPNRHFSRSMLLTEKSFRVVHFDRSGVYATPLFDIHKDAALFVQFIIGLTSPNEQNLGLDTSVQWVIDGASGKKVSGTITVDEYDDEEQTSISKTYNLEMGQAPFVRPGIRSRGTVCWYARDPVTGEGVIIKDAWRSDTRSSEVEYLLKARGISGVVQLLGYQDACATTTQYRPPGFDLRDFRNRLKLRLVLKKYGDSIWFFRSRLQLLCALRDALIGHCQLFEKGVIHRDISMLNILLSHVEDVEGSRGNLIDLDMAAPVEEFKSTLPSDPFTGTRTYQSIMGLRSSSMSPSPPQDYTDELESLFYVYCNLLYAFEKPGVLLDEGPDILADWDSDDAVSSANAKVLFMLTPTKDAYVPPYWGAPCVTLLQEFHSVVRDAYRRKELIYANRHLDAEAKGKAFDGVARNFKVPFSKTQAAFDRAIAKLEKEGLNAEEREPYPKASSAPHVVSSIRPASKAQDNEYIETRPPPASVSEDHVIPVVPNPPVSKKRPSDDHKHSEGLPQKRFREAKSEDSLTVGKEVESSDYRGRDAGTAVAL